MSRLLPPPHLLRALIATSSHGSVVRASEELHLTASAVSKQLLELENRFGLALFKRVRKRLIITAGGKRYVERLTPLLDELERATRELLTEHPDYSAVAQCTLRLSMLPTIGAKWLIPRLPDFLAKHPTVDLGFVPFVNGYDFEHPQLDCAIRYGDGLWAGAQADYLMGRELIVIATPGNGSRLQKPDDVQSYTLLHHASEPEGWARWCAHHGVADGHVLVGPQIDQVASQIQAVRAGLGIALVPRCLVEDDIASGAVVEAPFPVFMQPRGYYFCYPDAKGLSPALRAFRAWILAQAGR